LQKYLGKNGTDMSTTEGNLGANHAPWSAGMLGWACHVLTSCDADTLGARPSQVQVWLPDFSKDVVDPELISKIRRQGTVPGFLRAL